jgi:uncharacterized protein YggE
MSMRPVRLVAGAAALAVMAGTGGWAVAGADAQPPRPVDPTGRISVTGVGNASGPPNTVIAQMHVDTSGDTVAAAMNSANAAAAAMQRALHRDGVAKSDLQTSNLSLNPTYNDRQELTGYEVTESLTATIRTLRRQLASTTCRWTYVATWC